MTPSRTPLLAFLPPLLALLALHGCGGSPSSSDGAPLQASVRVMERGALRAQVDQAWIDGHAPAFAWGQGRGWRLRSFFSDRWTKPGFELRVSGATGDAVVFPDPGTRRDGREPVLIVNLKGEALVTLADADGNTDSFHGRGGARKRSGDDSPRVVGVRRIELLASAGERRAGGGGHAKPPSEPVVLRVTGLTDGATLSAADLGALKTWPVTDDQGTPRGVQAWDLRDVAATLGGDQVVAVVDKAGARTALDPSLWADASKRPTLRLNRRGAWKMQWLGPNGAPLWDLPSAGDVVALELRAP